MARKSEVALRYVGEEAGLRRQKRGRGWSYSDAQGARVSDRATLQRIRSLAIPPAWSSVWICADERGHLQASGRDARGRKQYRYHAQWRTERDGYKFDRLVEFGEILPQVRRRVEKALGSNDLSRERVLAAVVSLLDSTLARIGNAEYRRANGSFGLTTLENRHARRSRGNLRLAFRGKSGVAHTLEVDDPRVARLIRRCQGLPGQRLFQYVDAAGEAQAIDSQDVNDWLREIAGCRVTAKEFRTWHGSALALDALRKRAVPASATAAREIFLEVVDGVALRLGNTRAVCRSHYVHPGLQEAFAAGELLPGENAAAAGKLRGLLAREARLLVWLRAQAARSEPLARAS